MPLLDHFQPPLHPQRSWESFHSRWANSIADTLQRMLPPMPLGLRGFGLVPLDLEATYSDARPQRSRH